MPHPPTSPPPAADTGPDERQAPRANGALAAGEEFRVTEDIPGDVRLCRIQVAEDECQGCVALLGDADQRPALEYLAQAGNRLASATTTPDAPRVTIVTGSGGLVACARCGERTDRPDRWNRCPDCAAVSPGGRAGEGG